MIVALARKLLIALWRFVTTGETLEGVILRPAGCNVAGARQQEDTLAGGNGRELLKLLARLKTRAEQRIAAPVKVVTIHEVGLDGFWIYRLLEANVV
jgi:hypothetical protein